MQRLLAIADMLGGEPAQRAADAGSAGGRETLPGQLRAGIEHLSGVAMNDVQVHRNSARPAGLDALAFAQGSHIHLAPGQDRNLPHEAWHVVQQRQGRVRATGQLRGVPLNTDASLEREADVMGDRAARSAIRAAPLPPPADRRGGAPAQRKIMVGGANINHYNLVENLKPLLDPRATRLLRPIYEAWSKGQATYPMQPVQDFNGLRTALVRQLVADWQDPLGAKLPQLRAFLPADQFNTLTFMVHLAEGFDAAELEKAFAETKATRSVDPATLGTLFSPGMLPRTPISYAIFAVDWTAQLPGIMGIIAEMETAKGIRSGEVQKGQKVSLGQDMQLGGGLGIQDVDVSFVNKAGRQVLIEVAATVDRLQYKMGAGGAAQRVRYERLVEVNPNRVLAYSVPRAIWSDLFRGNPGIATRLAGLDGVGWGLILSGHYADPEELTAMAGKLRAASGQVPGFWEALAASRMSYDAVQPLSANDLQKRLQRNAPRK